MQPKLVSLQITIILLCLTFCPIAATFAQNPGFYLKLDGGLNYVQDTGIKVAGHDGELSINSGYRVVVGAGYELNRWLAVELEGGFFDDTINKIDMQGVTMHVQKSSLSGVPILANVLLRYENASDFMPFIAVGAGGLRSNLRISGEKDDNVVFAVQAQAGVVYKLDEQAWIEVGYRLLAAPRQTFDLAGTSIEADPLFSHFFGVGAIWKF